MIRYILLIVFMTLIMLFEIIRHKSIMNATVIYPVMWMLSLLALIIQKDKYWLADPGTLVLIGAGYVLFCLGYELAVKLISKREDRIKAVEIRTIYWNYGVIALVSILIGIGFARVIRPYMDFSDLARSWVGIKDRVLYGEIQIPYYLTVARYFNRVAIWFVFLKLVFSKEKKQTIVSIVCLVIICVSALIASFTDFSRNDMLFAVLPVAFLFLMKKPLDNKRNIFMLGIAFVAFLAFFLWFVQYRATDNVNMEITNKMRLDSLFNYLSDPIAGLNSAIKNESLKLVTTSGGGRYTLSGVWGLLSKFFGNYNAPDVLQYPIEVGPGGVTNVFTVYQWTGLDFGLLYALMWQFVFGGLYGLLFKFSVKGNEYAVFGYSVLSYPLVMMFFEDQYFSIGQSWIIFIGFGVLIWLMTRIGLKKNDNIGSSNDL